MNRYVQNLSRIQILNVENSAEVVDRLRGLQACTTSAELLPNLRWICLRNVTGEMMAFFARLLNRNLKRCTIVRQSSDVGACAVVGQLAQFCPSLEHLTIWCPLPLDAVRMVATFTSLHTVTYYNIDQWSNFETFIQSLRTPKLKNLSLGVRRTVNIPDFKKVLRHISTFHTLKHLSLSIKLESYVGPDRYDISPLFALKDLELLNLQLPCIAAIGRTPLGDEHVRRLAEAFPKLKMFSVFRRPLLGPEDTPPPRPAFTFHALELFATTYPRLDVLRIDLDTSLPAGPLPLPTARCRHAIALDLVHNAILEDRAFEAAAYVSGVYPNATLRSSESRMHNLEAGPTRPWKAVKDLLPHFSRAREHERLLLADNGLA